MLVFLKNAIAQINLQTRQGNAAVARTHQIPDPAERQSADTSAAPARFDAVTSGTQAITSYFTAAHTAPPRSPRSP